MQKSKKNSPVNQLKLTILAQEDLFEIWHFIAVENNNPENADRFIDELDAQLWNLAQNPGIGTLKEVYVKGVRQFVFKGYLIFYFSLNISGIEVLRIIHGARDISGQFE